jgi:hypothetical protein
VGSRINLAWHQTPEHTGDWKRPALKAEHREILYINDFAAFGVMNIDAMENTLESLAEYANVMARELCLHIEQHTKGIYNRVLFIDPGDRPVHDPPNLFLHRSEPCTWDNCVSFNLYAVDDGDLAYEPRLQIVEDALQKRSEVRRLGRMTAPDTMIKDMLNVEIVLTDRRTNRRLANVDSRHA